MRLSLFLLVSVMSLVSACAYRRADESSHHSATGPSPGAVQGVHSANGSRQVSLCGELFFDFGDRIGLRSGSSLPRDAVLLVRDSRSLAFIEQVTTNAAGKMDGGNASANRVPIRVIAVAVVACSDDPRTNAAACIQAGRDKAFSFVREMLPTEKCDDVEAILSEMR